MATKKEEEKQNQDKEKDQTAASNAQAEFDVNQEINELLQALEGDLSTTESEGAIGLIDKWYSFLHKSKEPEVKELASGLKELQKMLKSGKATGHEISEELIHIGEQTTEFSDNAEKGLKQTVQRLGKQLRKVGTSIAKAEDQEYHQQIDTLLERAEGEELTSLDAEAAVGAIDLWYNVLHKADGEQFQQLANSLKELKQVLKRGNAKSETVARALTHVGEQTTQVASETPRGFKRAIQKLGKQLTKAAESLTAAK
jgi:ABC-type transporter Mla subunit MlaD